MIEIAALKDPNDKPKRWREVAPRTFHDVDRQDTLIFKPDQNGRMQLILPYPFMVFERIGFWENGKILLPVLGISLFIMLLTLVLWFVAWLGRRHYGHKLELTPTEWRQGILLDPVYTGKAMVDLIDLIEQGYFKKGSKIIFLHSGGTPALFPYREKPERVPVS